MSGTLEICGKMSDTKRPWAVPPLVALLVVIALMVSVLDWLFHPYGFPQILCIHGFSNFLGFLLHFWLQSHCSMYHLLRSMQPHGALFEIRMEAFMSPQFLPSLFLSIQHHMDPKFVGPNFARALFLSKLKTS